MIDPPTWMLRGQEARLQLGSWQAGLRLDDLAVGLRHLQSGPQALPVVALFGLLMTPERPRAEVMESYCRGTDLIAVLTASRQRPIRIEARWRAGSVTGGGGLSIDLQISAQTPLLDASPQFELLSSAGGELITPSAESIERGFNPQAKSEVATCVALWRFDSLGLSLLTMVHPSDFCGIALDQPDGLLSVRFPLFRERLEKGVVRRARARALFIASHEDLERAFEEYRTFANESPDLSA